MRRGLGLGGLGVGWRECEDCGRMLRNAGVGMAWCARQVVKKVMMRMMWCPGGASGGTMVAGYIDLVG